MMEAESKFFKDKLFRMESVVEVMRNSDKQNVADVFLKAEVINELKKRARRLGSGVIDREKVEERLIKMESEMMTMKKEMKSEIKEMKSEIMAMKEEMKSETKALDKKMDIILVELNKFQKSPSHSPALTSSL